MRKRKTPTIRKNKKQREEKERKKKKSGEEGEERKAAAAVLTGRNWSQVTISCSRECVINIVMRSQVCGARLPHRRGKGGGGHLCAGLSVLPLGQRSHCVRAELTAAGGCVASGLMGKNDRNPASDKAALGDARQQIISQIPPTLPLASSLTHSVPRASELFLHSLIPLILLLLYLHLPP